MMPLGLGIYRALTHGLTPLAPAWLGRRAKAGKEEAARIAERFGITDMTRPTGTLVWLHGASVGEAELALNLMQAMLATRDDLHFLITTGTRTSADMVARRLGKNAVHQYLPLDLPRAVTRFMAHWHPDLGVLMESELWPNLILAAKAHGTPLALANARMNEYSLHRWKSVPFSAAKLIRAFDWIGAADRGTRAGLMKLSNQPYETVGNLKFSMPAPMADKSTLSRLQAAMKDRPVWLALSTHEGEDKTVLRAHQQILQSHPNALLVLVPRHPERADKIITLCDQAGLATTRHSTGANPDEATRVYLGDSIGEMGLWLRLGTPAFIGGSLLPTLSGHNPLEAARLNVPVLCGLYCASFQEIYEALIRAEGARPVKTGAAMARAVLDLWDNPDKAKAMSNAANTIAHDQAKAPLQATLAALMPLIRGGE
ncbi:MAG: 3-deoxy-D-manno-octulosonic acid transferase [Robiginitomaculum sp.]|nr:3-deoxy-D-manno-octulosonic acid transferase [Robiginitomaculum sp.]MDQ7077012.1 3-deoxy-D-manno-octulosonic acid transferase [Robiginitomaculum sp.]